MSEAATEGLLYDGGPGYADGEGKARYLAAKYAPVLTGSVLDVGCGRRRLAALVPRPDLYVGVDMKPPCDVVVDLEHEPLPFADRSFEAVTCCDVLEHLERAHAMLDECCRVSASRVIVSLPNPVRDFLTSVFAGSGGRLKYYGLPPENPGNRHRWFFGFEEACEFVQAGAARNGFEVEQLDSANDGCNYWLNGRGEDVLDHPNIKRGAMWAILRRR
jgi:SAM-dependent methyltransferase